MSLSIRPEREVRWDVVAFGEVMLRFDPGPGRVRTTRSFTVSEGGGEYNVARAARKVFGLRSAHVTAIIDNELGHLLEDLMMTGGVDLRHVVWRAYDGVGDEARLGLNFVEKGFGIRPAKGTSDRAHTAVSQLRPGDIDWDAIFAGEGARWFHTGGIAAALGPQTADVVIEAMQSAKRNGTIVSYDLNFRPSLWARHGGIDAAVETNRRVAPLVDVMIGNEEDFSAGLGFAVPDMDDDISEVDTAAFRSMIGDVTAAYPNFSVVATTLRTATTASRNDWGGILWSDGRFHEARHRVDLEIYDRVGGGDGFASGMIHAFLRGLPPEEAVEWGATHGALTMTTPGDTSMMTAAEVERAISARTARVVR